MKETRKLNELKTCRSVEILIVDDDALAHAGVIKAVSEAVGLGLGLGLGLGVHDCGTSCRPL